MDNLLKVGFYLAALGLICSVGIVLYEKQRVENFLSAQTQNLLDMLNAQLDADQKAKTNLINTAQAEVDEAQSDVDQARKNEETAKSQLDKAMTELASRKETQNRITQTLANRIPPPS
jgi:biopolymer transport protein ExbB/TolQ